MVIWQFVICAVHKIISSYPNFNMKSFIIWSIIVFKRICTFTKIESIFA